MQEHVQPLRPPASPWYICKEAVSVFSSQHSMSMLQRGLRERLSILPSFCFSLKQAASAFDPEHCRSFVCLVVHLFVCLFNVGSVRPHELCSVCADTHVSPVKSFSIPYTCAG